MSLQEALAFVRESSVDDLRNLPKEALVYILQTLNPEDVPKFLFAKNIKIFGGINEYIHDFFAKHTVQKILAFPEGPNKERNKHGLRQTLQTMASFAGVTEENKDRIRNALRQVSNTYTASAAGGTRKNRRKATRTKKRTLV